MNDQNIISVGIDWADAKHDCHLIGTDGQQFADDFEQDPRAIAAQIESWRKHFPGALFAVAIEATKGAIINALLEYPDLQIYPVNPAALASYRKAFAHGGGKNDPVDAKLLAQFIHHYGGQLRPLKPNGPLTRKIATLAEDRRRLVDQRADLANELGALLKQYFPAALQLKPARTYSEFFLKFLLKYPTLQAAQAAGPTRVRRFFHGIGVKAKADLHAETLRDAVPLTCDEATIETAVMRATAVIEQLQTLTKHIKRYDSQLRQLVPQHDLYKMVKSLPGGAINMQARMIAALGDDRTRYPQATSLQRASGIAPVTSKSGRQCFVSARWACTKFMKQTFHEYAGLSIRKSRWAKAYYDEQQRRGATPQMAKRSLAYKWQRIIHKMWQTGDAYDENRYLKRLQSTDSPLAALLESVP